MEERFVQGTVEFYRELESCSTGTRKRSKKSAYQSSQLVGAQLGGRSGWSPGPYMSNRCVDPRSFNPNTNRNTGPQSGWLSATR